MPLSRINTEFAHVCPICHQIFETKYKRRGFHVINSHTILYMHIAKEHKQDNVKVSLACHPKCNYVLEDV